MNQTKSSVTNVKHINSVADRNCTGYEDFKEVKYKHKTQLKDLKDKKQGKNDREKEKSNENFSSMKRFKVKVITDSANKVGLNPLSVVEKHRYRYLFVSRLDTDVGCDTLKTYLNNGINAD